MLRWIIVDETDGIELQHAVLANLAQDHLPRASRADDENPSSRLILFHDAMAGQSPESNEHAWRRDEDQREHATIEQHRERHLPMTRHQLWYQQPTDEETHHGRCDAGEEDQLQLRNARIAP